jgi:riboflavin synthase
VRVMFTGLVAETGTVRAVEGGPDGIRLRVATPLAGELSGGDSVAVNGVCLTAATVDGEGFAADVMAETLRRSSLGPLAEGDRVNLELPLRAGDRLGGHVVQGHVDGTGTVGSVRRDGLATVMRIEATPELLRYVVEKGSIAVDGVSLTVAEVDGEGFSVSLIPETQERTTLGSLEPGRTVNLEVDVLAKYVEKLVEKAAADHPGAPPDRLAAGERAARA